MLDKYKKALVTGGAGFIGSHICEELVKIGKQVVTIDDLSTGKIENVPSEVEFIERDISRPEELNGILNDIDIVFHVAAQPSTRKSLEDPKLDFNSNMTGTFNMLTAALAKKVSRFIYTSSSAAYGEPKQLPMKEDDYPLPTTPYGASKLCGEIYSLMFKETYGLPVTCLRPFNVYGTRENLETSLDEVVLYTRAILNNEPITVYGDGNQARDFVYVKDVAQAHILAAEHDESIGKVINVGTGNEVTINMLIAEIESASGKRAVINREPWPGGDIYQEYADVNLANNLLGFTPATGLVEGLRIISQSFQIM